MRAFSGSGLGKKGFGFDAIWQIVLLIILVGVALLFYFMVQWFGNISIDTQPAEAATIINRIYYSPNGISFHDGTRAYPGIIDVTRFLDEQLEEIHDVKKNKHFAVELQLFNDEHKPILNPIYLNKVWYDRWDVLTAFRGEGATRRFTETRYVLLTTSGGAAYTPGYLHFTVIMPRDA